ncbi:hypothetical protein JW962_00595 [Candidatus Dojkabacteria bacterium]|nr:hypothetical protein [Candidatus Dojkabacteria bacterium]
MDQQQTPTFQNNAPQGSAQPNTAADMQPKIDIPADDSSHPKVGVTSEEELELRWRRYKCLVCGFLYEGNHPLKKCPKCGNDDSDKFTEAD